MDSIMLNNNQRNFITVSQDGTDNFIIHEMILYGDSSFLSHSQSLALKVFKDGIEVLNKHISTYPLKDEAGTVAEVNEKFSGYNELMVEIYDDNTMLSDELNFNLELQYMATKPVSH